jgi:hypothetical protein
MTGFHRMEKVQAFLPEPSVFLLFIFIILFNIFLLFYISGFVMPLCADYLTVLSSISFSARASTFFPSIMP